MAPLQYHRHRLYPMVHIQREIFMSRVSSILRKRRASEKVYLASNARDNQYIIAEMPLTDELIELIVGKVDINASAPYQTFYQSLANIAFKAIEQCGIEHANFVANSRLVRVRNSDEQQVLHTPQQSFFFYNPGQNSTFKGYFDGQHRSNKVKFLFLATGDNLRADSAKFHQKVCQAVDLIASRIGLPCGSLKVRDHQHLTYDIFAKEKGHKETVTHTFRSIPARYLQQGYQLPDDIRAITYAVVSIPMTRRLLKDTAIDHDSAQPYSALYQKISDAFIESSKQYGVTQGALIGNGLSPIVRYDESESTVINGEIISLGFDPNNDSGELVSKWEGDKLVDTIRLVYCATNDDETHNSYGKFVNQITECVADFAQRLNWKKDCDYMLMRLNQQVIRRI